MPSWDLPSTACSWFLALVGVVLAMIAAHVCHTHSIAAMVCMLISALATCNHLGFAATVLASQSWLATRASAPRLGPAQQRPRVRKGLPGLKSPGGAAGLDGWSFLLFGILALPLLVPLLAYHRPAEHFKWRKDTPQYSEPIGATSGDNFNHNGASWYTVGSYEAVDMSLHATVTGGGVVTMHNTADIAVDAANHRVILPSRVEAACKYEKVKASRPAKARGQASKQVKASGLKALLGTYACSKTMVAQAVCTDPATGTTSQDFVCLDLYNATRAPIPQQFMTVWHPEMLVTCNVTYSVATVDVTWHGADKDLVRNGDTARLCRISQVTVYDDVPEDKTYNLTNKALTGSMLPLQLPLVNAFRHTVDHARLVRANDSAVELFYGSIFAAATAIRSISEGFDPTKWGGAVDVHYTERVCQQYGWSWLTILLLLANVVLAITCTVVASGATLEHHGSLTQEAFGMLRCSCCHPAKATTYTGRSDTSGPVLSVQDVGNGATVAALPFGSHPAAAATPMAYDRV